MSVPTVRLFTMKSTEVILPSESLALALRFTGVLTESVELAVGAVTETVGAMPITTAAPLPPEVTVTLTPVEVVDRPLLSTPKAVMTEAMGVPEVSFFCVRVAVTV